MAEDKTIENRKADHIRICLDEDVSFSKKTGFERYELEHCALPDVNIGDIDLSTGFLGKPFNYPFFICAITGGTNEAEKINKTLAKAAESLGIGFGLGSQRAMLKDPSKKKSYEVRDVAPSAFIAGNIGAVQLPEYNIEQIDSLVSDLRLDALCIHLNAAQEAVQKEGDTNWQGVFHKIKEVASSVKFPVIVKEVGNGISGRVAKELKECKVSAIDIAGAGGTSWTKVEQYRNNSSDTFNEWGIPTAQALTEVRQEVKLPLIASGGIRSGIDAAKALVMGANLVGFALPVLKPATEGFEEVVAYFERIAKELRTAMFLVNASNLEELRRNAVLKYI
ncbi:MAG: type 2 isopentenyl-diphosphate Delta-isomerase [Candidatus Aenigmarchaeota archaeon]|nr:type 2 isopentenyl-diphosphate Delta-isomerase [Candidatus Aenigmarchaeota archaeon]